MKTKILFSFLSVLLFSIFVSCSKTESNPTEVITDDIAATTQEIKTVQDNAGKTYLSLLTKLTPQAAKDSIAKLLLKDPSVKNVTNGAQGISIEYKDGIKGGIFLDPKDSADTAPQSIVLNKDIKFKKIAYPSKKAILLNPHYSDRSSWTNQIVANYNEYLPKCDISFNEFYKNEQVTLDRYASLKGNGIVHIYSHGFAYPDEKNISDVYVMSGEQVSDATSKKYADDLKNGNVIISSILKGTESLNVYWVNSKFISKYNDFSADSTLFIGGFCYSFLGSWPELITNAKVAAYTGHSWYVSTTRNSEWARYMVTAMADTAARNVFSISYWFDRSSVDKNYYCNSANKTVELKYNGNPNLRFWDKLKLVSLTPSSGTFSTDVILVGSGFKTTQGSSKVMFNGTSASITDWSADKILVKVPNNAKSGNVIVNVNGKNSNGLWFSVNKPVITTLSVDSAKVGDNILINGTYFGTNQSLGGVYFGGVKATSYNSWTNTQIGVKIPDGAVTGSLYVVVESDTSNIKSFKVITPVYLITKINPVSALPGNTVNIYGVWPKEINPPNTFVQINDTQVPLASSSLSGWNTDKVNIEIPAAMTTGVKNISFTYKGVQSNKVSYLIGIPIDSITVKSKFLYVSYIVYVEGITGTGKTNAWVLTPRVSGYAKTTWLGKQFSVTYTDDASTSKINGTLADDGATLVKLKIELTDPSGSAIIDLIPNKQMGLEKNYAMNLANTYAYSGGMAPPYYLLETSQKIKDNFSVSGTYTINGEIYTITGVDVINNPNNMRIGIQFRVN